MRKRLGTLMGLALLLTVTGTGVASASVINTGVPTQVDLPFTDKSVANQQASHQQSLVNFSYSNIDINAANGTTFLTVDPPSPMW